MITEVFVKNESGMTEVKKVEIPDDELVKLIDRYFEIKNFHDNTVTVY